MNALNKTSFRLTSAYSLWNILFLLTMFVYAAGLFITIMEPDAAVYAEISMEMHDSGNFLSIFHKGADWLDKPHFPFWMTAISYNLFGVSMFAYKLPGIVFVLLGAVYTFLFARKYYSPMHGYIAAIILLTAQHIIISNQDVRAEPFMTGLLIMALYHLTSALESGAATSLRYKLLHIAIGSLGLACLIMTKGLFTIIPVGAGIGLSLLYSRKWSSIFHWQWLLCIALTLVFLMPSLYAYYLQFDLHPEKKIFGQYHVSGVKFFLWTSQWGRFTNTGPIKGRGDLFFFVHTTLWAFLPWAFLAFFALYRKSRALIKKISTGENYTYFGFITLFLVFSVSKFQLSFYLNPIFPLLSVLCASALLSLKSRAVKVFSVIHLTVCCLLIAALCALHIFFMSEWPHADTLLILAFGFGLAIYLFARKGRRLKKILFATALVTLSVNYYVNRDFYQALLKYQSESEMAYYVQRNNLPADSLVIFGEIRSVEDIILHKVVPVFGQDTTDAGKLRNKYVFTNEKGLRKLDSLGLKYATINTFDDFHVTMLNGKFINKKTRAKAVDKTVLLKVGE
ncbi:MAG: glycosyltransferase family 39 protein [Flavitalea sp.]